MPTYNIKWVNNLPKFNQPKLSTTNNTKLKLGGRFKYRSVKQKKKNKKRTFRKYLKKIR
jgi:hypothetical protein